MQSPQKIGKFRVIRLLGQGAMGRVFLAEDPLIDRQVAIKVMTAEGDDEAQERFRNEARTAGQLSHPNIVQLYEFGFHQGQPFLAMEYLVGESLDLWLARKQPLKARLSVLLDLCRAIGHAHSRGVLHRDVKPSNLQVLPDGACKLMDFGIARSSSVRLTATGMILGTPEFIAPEVLQDAGYSDRSDLFAVGLVAYQTLGGANPFHATTLEACLTRVLTYKPPPLAEACPGVPIELSDVVSSYLSKSPEERPSDVRPLMAALARLQDRTLRLASDPSLAAPLPVAPPPASTSQPQVATEAPTLRGPVPSPVRDRRLLPAAALLAILAVALLAATFWRPWSDPEPVAEITATPLPAVASAQPALETGPRDDGVDLAATPAPGGSSAAPPARGPTADSGPAAGTRNAVEGHVVPASTVPPEEAAEDGPVTAPERVPPSLPDQSTADPVTPVAGQATTADRRPSDQEEPPVSRPPSTQKSPESMSTRELPVGETPAEEASTSGMVRGEEAAGVSGQERSGIEPTTPAPRIDRLEPMIVRRGSKTVLLISGSGFGRGSKAVIRRGGRPVRGMRMMGSRIEGTSKLRVTLLVAQQPPLGPYTVTVVDADRRESNAISLEVGL